MSTQGLSGGGFNFDTQADIAHLLASVRSANISAEQKNDIRDTIFLYTNGGRDQTVLFKSGAEISFVCDRTGTTICGECS